jgi:hypothetical protein
MPACQSCAATYEDYGASVVYHAAPIPSRPECADGCPLTTPCTTGCARATRQVDPLTVTITAAITNGGGHVGAEPAPPVLEPAPPTDPPFSWAPYLALAAVTITAVVCALAGWTR